MDSVDEHADAVTDVPDANAVTLLRQFLAINTSPPSPDYQVTPLTVDGIQLFFFRGQPVGWSSKRVGWGLSVVLRRRWRESLRW